MRALAWLCLTGACALGLLLAPGRVFAAGLGCCLLLPPVSWCLLLPARRKAALEVEAPALGEKGRQISLELRSVAGRLPTGPVTARLTLENTVTGELVRRRVRLTGARRALLDCPWCGCLELRLDRALLWDLWGLLPLPIPAAVTRRILIMPNTFPVELTLEAAPAHPEDCREYAQDRRGQDRTETYQLRDYAPGDSLNRIHWKLTSKRETLLVRDPACPVDRSLMVFVDRTWGPLSPRQADGIMETAVSVAQALWEGGIPFRLCWNGESIRWVEVTRENFPEAVGALLRSRTMTGIGGTELYLHTLGPPAAGRVLYLGTRLPEEAFARAVPCGTVVLEDFTPEAAAEALRNLEWS